MGNHSSSRIAEATCSTTNHETSTKTDLSLEQWTGSDPEKDESAPNTTKTNPSVCSELITTWSFDGNRSAQAMGCCFANTGVILTAIGLMGLPLLNLAEHSAGCYQLTDKSNCQRVYGFKPSSLLTATNSVTSMVVALLLPALGAWVDRTPYRRGVLSSTAAFMVVLCVGLAIIVSEDTWFIILCLSVLGSLAYHIHITMLFAYVSELSESTSVLTEYNSKFFVLRGITIFPFLIAFGVMITIFFKLEDMSTIQFEVGFIRVISVVESVFLIVLYGLAFFRGIPKVPPKQDRVSLLDGFRDLARTSSVIFNEHPHLFWYLVVVVIYSNIVSSIGPIMITFMISHLNASYARIGYVGVAIAIGNLVGSRVHPRVAARWNLLVDLRINLVGWILLCVLLGVVITGPDRWIAFVVLITLLAFFMGWAIPNTRTLYIALMPRGRETEYMGIYVFAASGFSWLPPTLFTILNESGVKMNTILLTGAIPLVLALFVLMKVASYPEAVARVQLREPPFNESIHSDAL